jgi:hypothetical protein
MKPEALKHGFPVARRTLDAIDRLNKIDESGEGKFSPPRMPVAPPPFFC